MMPHQYVPWSLGRDFDTEPWTPDQPRLTGVAQAAVEVNLTEDNLPSYHRQLLATFDHDTAWNTWSLHRRGRPSRGRPHLAALPPRYRRLRRRLDLRVTSPWASPLDRRSER
jgi:hypothetical protein